MPTANGLIDDDESAPASELFHENSKQRRSDLAFVERIVTASASPYLHQMLTSSRKRYPSATQISLPAEFPPSKLSFDKAVTTRRSNRMFSRKPLELGQVAKLLHHAAGITGWITVDGAPVQPLRAAPSAGALFPIEIYLLALRIKGLKNGNYHFDSLKQHLEVVSVFAPAPELERLTFLHEVGTASAVFVLTGIPAKSRLKYGERGYRFMLLEAGHIGQNVLLTAQAQGLAAFTVGGFIDDELDALLRIEGSEEFSLYLIAVGNAASS